MRAFTAVALIRRAIWARLLRVRLATVLAFVADSAGMQRLATLNSAQLRERLQLAAAFLPALTPFVEPLSSIQPYAWGTIAVNKDTLHSYYGVPADLAGKLLTLLPTLAEQSPFVQPIRRLANELRCGCRQSSAGASANGALPTAAGDSKHSRFAGNAHSRTIHSFCFQ